MADIVHDFIIKGAARDVFAAIATGEGLAAWWTKRSTGTPEAGARFMLDFGPRYQWSATVTRCEPGRDFELTIAADDGDWNGTRVGFVLEERDGATSVRFRHDGWPEANEHYRISCYCWAMYLRLLKRHVERRELVVYEQRLDA